MCLETIFDIPSSESLMMHILISANNEKELKEMIDMAKSLKSSETANS